jgi:septation ring formation regulator EzrA
LGKPNLWNFNKNSNSKKMTTPTSIENTVQKLVDDISALQDQQKKNEEWNKKLSNLLSKICKSKLKNSNCSTSISSEEKKCSDAFPKFVYSGPDGYGQFLKTTFRTILEESFTEFSTIQKMR